MPKQIVQGVTNFSAIVDLLTYGESARVVYDEKGIIGNNVDGNIYSFDSQGGASGYLGPSVDAPGRG